MARARRARLGGSRGLPPNSSTTPLLLPPLLRRVLGGMQAPVARVLAPPAADKPVLTALERLAALAADEQRRGNTPSLPIASNLVGVRRPPTAARLCEARATPGAEPRPLPRVAPKLRRGLHHATARAETRLPGHEAPRELLAQSYISRRGAGVGVRVFWDTRTPHGAPRGYLLTAAVSSGLGVLSDAPLPGGYPAFC
jgi:hypothetical protein